MSDTFHPMEADRRRTLTSLAAALGVHVAVLAIMGLAFALRGPSPEITTPIDVQIGSGSEGAGQELSQGSGHGPGAPGPAASGAAVSGPVAPGPAASSAQTGGAALPGKGSEASGGFVIPTVRKPAPDSAPTAGGGASFREAGGRTGAGGTLPAVQNQLPAPAVAASPQGRSSGAGTAGGTDMGAQRSGEGVAVGPSNPAAGPLDLGKLDQAIAGRGAGTSGAAGAGAGAGGGGARAGTGQPGGKTGQGSAGGGGGTGGAGGGGAGDYRVVWDRPDANKGRVQISGMEPKLPAWVNKQGLTLRVTVSFVLMPDGGISVVSMERSSGYADVDSAFKEAIRRWRFNAAKGGEPVTGLIPYVVNLK